MTQLTELSRDNAFPAARLAGMSDALVLFAACWHGRQDAVFVADAGLTATCVDHDDRKLEQMASMYPESWEFVAADVFQWTSAWATAGRRWDVVTIDCPTNLFDRCATLTGRWCELARRIVVLGCSPTTIIQPPDGWTVVDRMRRSDYRGGVEWAVIERAWS